jgi:hypothetical protein
LAVAPSQGLHGLSGNSNFWDLNFGGSPPLQGLHGLSGNSKFWDLNFGGSPPLRSLRGLSGNTKFWDLKFDGSPPFRSLHGLSGNTKNIQKTNGRRSPFPSLHGLSGNTKNRQNKMAVDPPFKQSTIGLAVALLKLSAAGSATGVGTKSGPRGPGPSGPPPQEVGAQQGVPWPRDVKLNPFEMLLQNLKNEEVLKLVLRGLAPRGGTQRTHCVWVPHPFSSARPGATRREPSQKVMIILCRVTLGASSPATTGPGGSGPKRGHTPIRCFGPQANPYYGFAWSPGTPTQRSWSHLCSKRGTA